MDSSDNIYKMKPLLVLLFCILSLQTYAQTESSTQRPRVQRFEVEVLFAGTLPISKLEGQKPQIGFGDGIEMRFNLQRVPLSFGLLAEQTLTWYKPKESDKETPVCESFIWALTGDWNFKQGNKVNPFAGLNVGIAGLSNPTYYEIADQGRLYPVFIPRIGVELGYHFRTHLDINIVRTSFSNVQLTIGGVIGGRPKKQK